MEWLLQLLGEPREAAQIDVEAMHVTGGRQQMEPEGACIQHLLGVAVLLRERVRFMRGSEQRFQIVRLPRDPESAAQCRLKALRLTRAARLRDGLVTQRACSCGRSCEGLRTH